MVMVSQFNLFGLIVNIEKIMKKFVKNMCIDLIWNDMVVFDMKYKNVFYYVKLYIV